MGLGEWHDGQSLDEVLTEADKQMYEAKEIHKRTSA
jgi:GGDEF domain-containing protein